MDVICVYIHDICVCIVKLFYLIVKSNILFNKDRKPFTITGMLNTLILCIR